MTDNHEDAIGAQLQQLARVADLDITGDRMPGIQRRVRNARRRTAALAVAAIALVTVGGTGLFQALPDKKATPPAGPTGTAQRVDIHADARGPYAVAIKFTVSGKSSFYVDKATGAELDYAGPASTTVIVDGEVVRVAANKALDGVDAVCRKGTKLGSYTLDFFAKKALIAEVSGPGAHEIEISAPYCLGGRIVESTQRIEIQTVEPPPTVSGPFTADLDGDGAPDSAQLIMPTSEEAQTLEVSLGDGTTVTATLPNNMERSIDLVDLDGRGAHEILVKGGGGEAGYVGVFVVKKQALVEVRYLDQTGTTVDFLDANQSASGSPARWSIVTTPEGIYSYLSAEDAFTGFPVSMKLRKWSLNDTTLTESPTITDGCQHDDGSISTGPC